MATTATLLATEQVSQKVQPEAKITLKAFLKAYSNMEDGYKYEFNQGIVEKTPRSMTPAQTFILNNLMRHFLSTKAYSVGGNLFVEIEMLTKPDQLRKPDICYRSAAQIVSGDYSVSEFAVEVISKHDKIGPVKEKIKEYFAAGMKVLWLIYPKLEEVEVYTSPRKSQMFSGKETVSAKPAIPDFSMKVEEIFEKPAIPAGKEA